MVDRFVDLAAVAMADVFFSLLQRVYIRIRIDPTIPLSADNVCRKLCAYNSHAQVTLEHVTVCMMWKLRYGRAAAC